MVNQAVPVHLRADVRRPPAEERHRIRPVGECLQRVPFDHPRFRRSAHRAPAPCSAAQFLHHPERLPFYSAHHVQMERVGIAVFRVFRNLRRGIIVIGNEVKTAELFVKVRDMLAEPDVGGNRDSRAVLPDQRGLPVAEFDHVVRGETAVVQHESRIHPRVRIMAVRRLDLLPGGVFPAPYDIAVGFVDGFQGTVFFPQPFAESAAADPAVALIGLQFIVDLPGDYRRIARVVFRHLLDDPFAVFQHCRMVDAPVAPNTDARGGSVFFDHHGIRIFLIQPQRRTAGGRAQNHVNLPLGKDPHRVVQPVEGKPSLLRLHTAPGELRQAHQFHTGFFHQVSIRLPQRSVPVFGIIICTDPHCLSSVFTQYTFVCVPISESKIL